MKRTLSIMFNPQRRFFYASLKVVGIAKKNTFSNTHNIVIVDQNIK